MVDISCTNGFAEEPVIQYVSTLWRCTNLFIITRKTAKYSNIQGHHIFQPVAAESLGPINASGRVLMSKLGRKLADQSGDDREISFFISATLRFDSAVQCHLTA